MSIFDGVRFFAFANALPQTDWGPLSEAAARSAVSRAYYAVFHAARERLRSESVSIGTGYDSHGQVIEAFEKNVDRARKAVGSRLRALRRQRNAADYDTITPFSWSDVHVELNLAQELLKEIRDLPGYG